jgi:C4-dicarboxylate-specific signal transduction histidine kinase
LQSNPCRARNSYFFEKKNKKKERKETRSKTTSSGKHQALKKAFFAKNTSHDLHSFSNFEKKRRTQKNQLVQASKLAVLSGTLSPA